MNSWNISKSYLSKKKEKKKERRERYKQVAYARDIELLGKGTTNILSFTVNLNVFSQPSILLFFVNI